eukprot:PLAT4441.3.p1 GENE.PLAT4441.3~~PLAT4441.3.p1  ORF type:complete len:1034 (+),score=390.25 PLAT4441.3:292-3102(+)
MAEALVAAGGIRKGAAPAARAAVDSVAWEVSEAAAAATRRSKRTAAWRGVGEDSLASPSLADDAVGAMTSLSGDAREAVRARRRALQLQGVLPGGPAAAGSSAAEAKKQKRRPKKRPTKLLKKSKTTAALRRPGGAKQGSKKAKRSKGKRKKLAAAAFAGTGPAGRTLLHFPLNRGEGRYAGLGESAPSLTYPRLPSRDAHGRRRRHRGQRRRRDGAGAGAADGAGDGGDLFDDQQLQRPDTTELPADSRRLRRQAAAERAVAPGGPPTQLVELSSLRHMWLQSVFEHKRLRHHMRDAARRPASAERVRAMLEESMLSRAVPEHAGRLSEVESARLAAMEKSLLEERRAARRSRARLAKTHGVYDAAHRGLRKLLNKRQPPQLLPALVSQLYAVELREQAAAVTLQRAWRHFNNLRWWRELMRLSRAVRKIQAAARRWIVRRRVQRWIRERLAWTIRMQSLGRRLLAQRAVARRRARQTRAALTLQCAVRCALARRALARARQFDAARRIQRLWRGAVGRARADRRWLDAQACIIQAVWRGYAARKNVLADRSAMNTAAASIQRLLRGVWARAERSRRLWQRETEARMAFVDELLAEESVLSQRIADEETAAATAALADKAQRLRALMLRSREEVDALEFDYQSLVMERARLSPRAVRQGWTEELDHNIEEHRRWLTEKKNYVLFELAPQLAAAEAQIEASDKLLAALTAERDMLQEERQKQWSFFWKRSAESTWVERERQHAERTASQKRRWLLKPRTHAGKPLKKEAIAEARERAKAVDGTSLASADLLAVPGADPESAGFHHLLRAVQLQNAMNTMTQYSALLAPIMDALSTASGMTDIIPDEEKMARMAADEAAAEAERSQRRTALGFDLSDVTHDGEVAELRPVAVLDRRRRDRRRRRRRRRDARARRAGFDWDVLDALEAGKRRLAGDSP